MFIALKKREAPDAGERDDCEYVQKTSMGKKHLPINIKMKDKIQKTIFSDICSLKTLDIVFMIEKDKNKCS